MLGIWIWCILVSIAFTVESTVHRFTATQMHTVVCQSNFTQLVDISVYSFSISRLFTVQRFRSTGQGLCELCTIDWRLAWQKFNEITDKQHTHWHFSKRNSFDRIEMQYDVCAWPSPSTKVIFIFPFRWAQTMRKPKTNWTEKRKRKRKIGKSASHRLCYSHCIP